MTPTPTPQEVQDLIAKVKALPAADANGHHTLRAAAAALSAYQQEVETLRERVAPWTRGRSVCWPTIRPCVTVPKPPRPRWSG
jgi:hypothetical protein